MKTKRKTQLRAVIGIGNYKGGVGKTTTTLNLAMALHLQGYRVMVIDMDPQANLSLCMQWDMDLETQNHPTLFGALCKNAPIPVYLSPSGLYYCPCTAIMDKVPTIMQNEVRNPASALSRALQKAPDDHTGEGITDWQEDFDFILIDSPVNPPVLTDNILIAANALLMPLNLEGFAMRGLKRYLAYVDEIHDMENPDLIKLGFLITRRKAYAKRHKKNWEEFVAQYGKDILPVSISEREAVGWSQDEGKSVYDIKNASDSRDEFTLLANEIIKRTKNIL